MYLILFGIVLFDKTQSPKIFARKAMSACYAFRYIVIMVLTCTPAVRPGRSIRPEDCTGPGRTSRKSGRCAERSRSTGPCNRPGMRTGTCRTSSCTCPEDGSRSVPDCCTRRDLYTDRIRHYNAWIQDEENYES